MTLVIMDILKNFNITGNDVQINIQGTIEEPLFRAREIAELLGLCNVHQTINDFDEDEKIIKPTATPGGTQNMTFLTELGLYRILGMCRKPVARKFQKWVCIVIKELRIKGKYELDQKSEQDQKLHAIQLELSRHETLKSSFENKRVIYFVKIRSINETSFILKLGWTDNVGLRIRNLAKQFGAAVYLDIFECFQNREFEAFLKQHVDFLRLAYKEDILEDVRSTETYLLSREEYKYIIETIVKKNVDRFQWLNPDQYIELEKLKVEQKRCEIEHAKLEILKKVANDSIGTEILNFLRKDIDKQIQGDEQNSEQMLTPHLVHGRSGSNRKIQKYDACTLKLIETYNGIIEVIRTHPHVSTFGIKNAATNNTVYNGYRWYFLDRDMENKEYELPETVHINSSVARLVAMVNKDKTHIEAVFKSQQAAMEGIGITRKQTINDAIKKQRLYKNTYYFVFYDDCSDDLKNEYLLRAELPQQNAKGKRINQIDIKTKQVITTYNCISEVIKNVCISRASVLRACINNEPHIGYLWSFA